MNHVDPCGTLSSRWSRYFPFPVCRYYYIFYLFSDFCYFTQYLIHKVISNKTKRRYLLYYLIKIDLKKCSAVNHRSRFCSLIITIFVSNFCNFLEILALILRSCSPNFFSGLLLEGSF